MAKPPNIWSMQLSICMFIPSIELAQSVLSFLQTEHYMVVQPSSQEEFIEYVTEHKYQLDCMILEQYPQWSLLVHQLQQHLVSMPTVIILSEEQSHDSDRSAAVPDPKTATSEDHIIRSTEVYLAKNHIHIVQGYIDKAISQFITHAVTTRLTDEFFAVNTPTELTNFIVRQQRRLMDKLHERLGYLGVYYKRNSKNFLRNLSATDRQKLLEQLKSQYRQIVLSYFSNDKNLNNKIDEYVNTAFFGDIPVTRIVEIHMDLMDNFSKQLKLEGRSEDILLDYRLTLIDTLAHLCEMYRRSIPRNSWEE